MKKLWLLRISRWVVEQSGYVHMYFPLHTRMYACHMHVHMDMAVSRKTLPPHPSSPEVRVCTDSLHTGPMWPDFWAENIPFI